LLKDRIYLDYNATSPLAKNVKTFLASSFFYDKNPSAQHSSGKNSRKLINQSIKNIKDIFSLDDDFNLFFHSGATEGVNTVVQGAHRNSFFKQQGFCFIYVLSDHKCILEQLTWLVALGATCVGVDIDESGQLNIQQLEDALKQNQAMRCLLNITWINNETGHEQDIDQVVKLKDDYDFFLHVDAAQIVGKIENWYILNKKVDAYTFSAHKFGALKASGFTFIKKDFSISPLIYGGAQQSNYRSGTENPMGAHCIALALTEVKKLSEISKVAVLKIQIINELKNILNKEVIIVSTLSGAVNTINFILKSKSADRSLPFFDMNGLDISNGSACNSGDSKKSHVLIALGYSEYAANAIRISLPLYDFDKELILSKLKACFIKLS
jgi:cysteine desulfurase